MSLRRARGTPGLMPLPHWIETLAEASWTAIAWSGALLLGAALIGWIAARVALAIFRRWTQRTDTPLDDYAADLMSAPIVWGAILIAEVACRGFLRLDEQTGASVAHTLQVFGIIVVGWTLARISRVVERALELRFDITQADNLAARAAHTQVSAFGNIARFAIWLFATAFVLMTFEAVRRIGVSLLASAGLAGVVLGFAAQRSIATVVAGVQIALTQPIRVDDVVIVEGEWGRIEEIRLTYVVVRIWDLRRLVVPITYFIEKPFQNWTRTSAELLGAVPIHVDYSLPVDEVRAELKRLLEASPLWDGKVISLQVVEAHEHTMVIRPLFSAADSGKAWDLRCEIREKLIAFIRERYPECLPRLRGELSNDQAEESAPRVATRES